MMCHAKHPDPTSKVKVTEVKAEHGLYFRCPENKSVLELARFQLNVKCELMTVGQGWECTVKEPQLCTKF